MQLHTLASVLLALMFSAVAGSTTALGCPRANFDHMKPAYELVAKAKQIVWADVVDIKLRNGDRYYTLDIIENIKGRTAKRVEYKLYLDLDALTGEPLSGKPNRRSKDFDEAREYAHSDPRFWLGGHAAGVMTGCSFVPKLARGRHLLFLDHEPHIKAFERVESGDDEWYRVVKQMVRDPSVRGRVGDPLDVMRMFEFGYLVRCAAAGPLARPPRQLFGRPQAMPRIFEPAFAIQPKDRGDFFERWPDCRTSATVFADYVALFRGADDKSPVLQPVLGDRIMFGERYADLVMGRTEISVEDTVQGMAK